MMSVTPVTRGEQEIIPTTAPPELPARGVPRNTQIRPFIERRRSPTPNVPGAC